MNRTRVIHKNIRWFLVASLVWAGCQNAPSGTTQSQEATHEHASESEAINLNDGAKWKVDEGMMSYIRIMEKEIHATTISEKKDFAALAKVLETQTNLLTENCTMTGIAHDELHKWLVPYIDLVSQLSKAKTNDESSELLKRLNESFDTFNRFFD